MYEKKKETPFNFLHLTEKMEKIHRRAYKMMFLMHVSLT